eukprot:NODE_271_length_12205_cov_0.703205.p5 type:complete len:300 gc:universal NODE_271_length_12205_cov_0.703205:9562-8663(-)
MTQKAGPPIWLMLILSVYSYDAFFSNGFVDSASCSSYLRTQLEKIATECKTHCSVSCESAFQASFEGLAKPNLPKSCITSSKSLSSGNGQRAQAIVSSILYSRSLHKATCSEESGKAASHDTVAFQIAEIVNSKLIASKSFDWVKQLNSSISEVEIGKLLERSGKVFGESSAMARFLTVLATQLKSSNKEIGFFSPDAVFSLFSSLEFDPSTLSEKIDKLGRSAKPNSSGSADLNGADDEMPKTPDDLSGLRTKDPKELLKLNTDRSDGGEPSGLVDFPPIGDSSIDLAPQKTDKLYEF